LCIHTFFILPAYRERPQIVGWMFFKDLKIRHWNLCMDSLDFILLFSYITLRYYLFHKMSNLWHAHYCITVYKIKCDLVSDTHSHDTRNSSNMLLGWIVSGGVALLHAGHKTGLMSTITVNMLLRCYRSSTSRKSIFYEGFRLFERDSFVIYASLRRRLRSFWLRNNIV
jgi:hypothetical protein